MSKEPNTMLKKDTDRVCPVCEMKGYKTGKSLVNHIADMHSQQYYAAINTESEEEDGRETTPA